MKGIKYIICILLFATVFLSAGCKANVNRPRATHAPIVDHTQPPLPEDYDYTAAEVKTQDGNVKYLTSSAFSSTRAKGEVSAEFKAQYSEFALRLLEECFEGSGTLVSPLSVLTALQMTANGAQGRTLDARVLHSDLLGSHMGRYMDRPGHVGYGYGPARELMSGVPHFRDSAFHGEFPKARVEFIDETFPGDGRKRMPEQQEQQRRVTEYYD